MADLRVEWVRDESRLDELQRAWDGLAEPEELPFLRHAWFRCWWEAFGAGRELRICLAWDGDELVGVLPLCARGRALLALANEHTPVFRPFGRGDGVERVVAEAVAASPLLALSDVPAADRAVVALRDAAKRANRIALVEPQHTSPVVDLAGTFGDYRSGLSKSLRKDADRRRRRLEEEHAVAGDVVAEPSQLDRELAEGFAVEASGWKGGQGTAILSSPDTTHFYRALGAAFAADGRLRLSTLRADGRAIAFDYCLLDHGRLWSLKLGIDDEFRRFAPGIMLTLAEIERSFELGLDALELLGGDEQWKTRFATSARAHVNAWSFARNPVPLTYSLYRRVRPSLVRGYRRVSGTYRNRNR